MQVVIDIPEWKYKSICEEIEASKRCSVVGIDHNIHEAIANGTPLPKGHGRLIEADKLPYEDIECTDGRTYMVVNAYDVDNAPTIIEADEESEDKE